jgi:7beta-hydroxy-3-oxochol-24-oyl-CoA 4-desaturase
MAPMATGWANHDGTISEKLSSYLEARARGGVGLIITEVATVDGNYPYVPATVGLWDDKQIPGIRKLTDVIHSHGAKIIPQISHPGPESVSLLFGDTQPVGPSQMLCHSNKQNCRELTVEEIETIVGQFAEAARRAREGGYDGLELHAAHSYMLLGSFISPLRNRRTDTYGGSIEGRLKLPLQVIERIRAKVGNDFPIFLRISGDELYAGGRDIRETQYIAPILARAGISAFDISAGSYPQMSWRIVPPSGTPFGINTPYSRAVKEVVDIPVMAVGRINEPRFAEDILARSEADLIGMGRALLADPELPNKAMEGKFDDIAPCTGCGVGCSRAQQDERNITCVINPAVGRESKLQLNTTPTPKRVLIIGAGPGGLETARVAALRGHQVILCDKQNKVGGQLNLASVPPMKQELAKWVQYLQIQIKKAGVDLRLNTEVTPDNIDQFKPDVVVIATGGEAFVPGFAVAGGKSLPTAHDVLAGNVTIQAGNVIVLGGGVVGCEVADFLANRGDNQLIGRTDVTIITGKEEVGLKLVREIRAMTMQRLREKGVHIINKAKVIAILEDGVRIQRNGQQEDITGADAIILARGVKSVDKLSLAIRDKVSEVYVIGDAKEPREAMEAIAEGSKVARDI